MRILLLNIAPLALLAGSLVLLGCSSYRLGSASPIPFDSLYIVPAQNESFAPQAQSIVSAQIRKTFIQDGRMPILANPEDAAARLEICLVDYQRNSAAYSSEDIDIARSYSLVLEAKVSLWDAHKGAYLFRDRFVRTSVQSYVGNPYDNSAVSANNFNAAEYNAMPLLARSLAEKISNQVLSPW